MAFAQYKDLTTFGEKHVLLVETNFQEQDMFEDPIATSPLHQQCVSEPNSEDSQESSTSIKIATNNHISKPSFMEMLTTKSLRHLLNNLNPISPSQKLSSTDDDFILVPPVDHSSGLMSVNAEKKCCLAPRPGARIPGVKILQRHMSSIQKSNAPAGTTGKNTSGH